MRQNKVGTTVISSFDYAVNSLGQRTAVSQTGSAFPTFPSWAWGYDSLGQVTTADSNIATSDRAYQYDTIGNRKKSVDTLVLPVANNYTANALNQYSSQQNPGSASAFSPVYDFDGNASSYPLPAAPSSNSTLTWDAENRLIASTVASVTTRYQYDAQSRRIAKIAGTGATDAANLYLYDGWNCVAEYTKTAGTTPVIALLNIQLWGKDLSGTMQGAGGVGGLLAIYNPDYGQPITSSGLSNNQYIAAAIHYPTYDGNGNVSEYLAENGTVIGHFEYDPFGDPIFISASSTILFSHILNYRFSTKPRDSETGLYYYGYRYYNPATGRWPNRDPIEEEGGINLYGFVGNDGVNKWDLLGQCEEAGTRTLITWDTDPYIVQDGGGKIPGSKVMKKAKASPDDTSLKYVYGVKINIKYKCCECREGSLSLGEEQTLSEEMEAPPYATRSDAYRAGRTRGYEMLKDNECE